MALVAVSGLDFHVFFEEAPPVQWQHPLDEVEHTELERLHSLLLLEDGLHEDVPEVFLAGCVVSFPCSCLLSAFALLLAIASDFVLLFAFECDDYDAVGVCISVVELQLDSKVIVPLCWLTDDGFDLRVATPPRDRDTRRHCCI